MKSECAGHWLNEEQFELHNVFPVVLVSKI